MKNTDVKEFFEKEQIEIERTYAIYMKNHDDPIEISYDAVDKKTLKENNCLLITEIIESADYQTLINCSEISHIVDQF